jgi:hypothetical protein
MKLQAKLSNLAAALALCALAGTAHAQQQDEERDDKRPLDYTAAQERLELEEPTIPSPDPNDGEVEDIAGTAEQDKAKADGHKRDKHDGSMDRHMDHDMQRTGAAQERDVKAVTPVGPPVVPVDVDQVGPAMVPVVPVGSLEGVETVTLETEHGPVVVVSYPGTVPPSEYNIDFSALDADDDGFISRTEVSASASRSEAAHNLNLEFQIADNNGDGKLAFPEIVEWVY